MELEWDEHNEIKLGKHRLEREDVEWALQDPDALEVPARRGGPPRFEPRFALLCALTDDVIIKVVLTEREDRFRVVSAYVPSDAEVRQYWRARHHTR